MYTWQWLVAFEAQCTDDEKMSNFIVGSSYEPLDVIGEGAYGIVWLVL
jgi:hypothetical protein